MGLIRVGPFALFPIGDSSANDVPDEAILVEVSRDGGCLNLEMVQFELTLHLRVAEVEPARLVDQLAHRLLEYYSVLRQLPAGLVGDVQRWQLDLVERVFLPWIGVELGRSAGHFQAPPGDTEAVEAIEAQLANA